MRHAGTQKKPQPIGTAVHVPNCMTAFMIPFLAMSKLLRGRRFHTHSGCTVGSHGGHATDLRSAVVLFRCIVLLHPTTQRDSMVLASHETVENAMTVTVTVVGTLVGLLL